MSKMILVALDNSDYADKVMLQAIELAGLYKTKLLGVSVIDESFYTNQMAAEIRNYWTVSYSEVLDKCRKLAEKHGVQYGQEILYGNPAEEIIEYARNKGADVIVLGHLGKTAAAGFPIGSVAQRVAAYSKCSTFIVK